MGTTRADGLWAITSYFNPMGYQRRRANYRAFRDRLGVPLVAVELAYGPRFELTERDADILIQLRGRDVMWQKERLLNVAVSVLPSSCRKVVWTDCDIVFEAEDWAERLSCLLERFPLVQAFSWVHHLSPLSLPAETLYTQPSAAFAIASDMQGPSRFGCPTLHGPGSTNNGLAWAMRREMLDDHGFYDACVVGGGDLAMVSAAYGCFDVVMRNMNEQQIEHYAAWARRCYERLRAEASFLDCRVFHLWHGAIDNRRYRGRHVGLRRYGFDPFEDVAHTPGGTWRWNTAKPEMHAYVRSYFSSRSEDG